MISIKIPTMKLSKSILVLFTVLLIPSLSWAQSSYKIGFVNTGKVLKFAPQALAVEQRLKESFLSRDKILKEKQKTLLELETKIKVDSLTSVVKRKLEREYRLKVSQLKFEQQEFKEDQNLKRNEEIRLLQNTIAKVLTQIGDEQKFDLILTEGVTFVSDKIDITTLVIEALKKEIEDSKEK